MFIRLFFPILCFLAYLPFGQINAKVLDKIITVFDENIQTLSQAQHILNTLRPRTEIAGQQYFGKIKTLKDVSNLFLEQQLIRSKLTELGSLITDDHVEMRIREFQKRQRITKDQLTSHLQSVNLSYDEYSQIIREIIEFSTFHSKVILPLISISEQEVKNEFFRQNINNTTLALRYQLDSFSISEKYFNKNETNRLKDLLKKTLTTQILPPNFSLNDLGTLTEDALADNVRQILKRTDEGEISTPVLISGQYHFFFVKKKDLIESEVFTKAKEEIQAQLFENAATKVFNTWMQQEKLKHYIKVFI